MIHVFFHLNSKFCVGVLCVKHTKKPLKQTLPHIIIPRMHWKETDLKQEKQDKLTSKAVVSGKEEASIFTTVFINWEGLSEFMAVYL